MVPPYIINHEKLLKEGKIVNFEDILKQDDIYNKIRKSHESQWRKFYMENINIREDFQYKYENNINNNIPNEKKKIKISIIKQPKKINFFKKYITDYFYPNSQEEKKFDFFKKYITDYFYPNYQEDKYITLLNILNKQVKESGIISIIFEYHIDFKKHNLLNELKRNRFYIMDSYKNSMTFTPKKITCYFNEYSYLRNYRNESKICDNTKKGQPRANMLGIFSHKNGFLSKLTYIHKIVKQSNHPNYFLNSYPRYHLKHSMDNINVYKRAYYDIETSLHSFINIIDYDLHSENI